MWYFLERTFKGTNTVIVAVIVRVFNDVASRWSLSCSLEVLVFSLCYYSYLCFQSWIISRLRTFSEVLGWAACGDRKDGKSQQCCALLWMFLDIHIVLTAMFVQQAVKAMFWNSWCRLLGSATGWKKVSMAYSAQERMPTVQHSLLGQPLYQGC